MSFGTGHHATTSMMIKMMSELDFSDKTVLDFGTGTGILAILSEKLGASNIIAIDHDDQSIKNARENFDSNNCSRIQLLQAQLQMWMLSLILFLPISQKELYLTIWVFSKKMVNDGMILFSGLLADDEQEILEKATRYNLLPGQKLKIKIGYVSK